MIAQGPIANIVFAILVALSIFSFVLWMTWLAAIWYVQRKQPPELDYPWWPDNEEEE